MLGTYDLGATTFYACQEDQRFSYCLYVPKVVQQEVKRPLLVVIHGSRRTAEKYRDACAEFAERHGVVVLCPLFPVGIPGPRDSGGYKFLLDKGIRYDRLLLTMVAEVGERYPVDTKRFYLHGFSGGGQFALRFLYLWPQRLAALSVGAPGLVTLPGEPDWWVGTGNVNALFGIDIDFDTMKKVPVQIVIGERDRDYTEITLTPQSCYWAEGANEAGGHRLARAHTLAGHWQQLGIELQLDIVPGVGHEGFDLLPQVFSFLEMKLHAPRGQPGTGWWGQQSRGKQSPGQPTAGRTEP